MDRSLYDNVFFSFTEKKRYRSIYRKVLNIVIFLVFIERKCIKRYLGHKYLRGQLPKGE